MSPLDILLAVYVVSLLISAGSLAWCTLKPHRWDEAELIVLIVICFIPVFNTIIAYETCKWEWWPAFKRNFKK